jgi:sugar-specific transcriptional regulator TrmB
MNAEQRVQELGLSSAEAALYVALLKSGGVPASQIAKEVGQRRTTAYATLKLLVQKGFVVAYLKKGRQVFVAEKPQNVAGYFQKRLRTFTESIPFGVVEKKNSSLGVYVLLKRSKN